MATAEECRTALEALAGRITEVDPAERCRQSWRTAPSAARSPISASRSSRSSGPDGAGPVTEARPGDPPAQVRFTAPSDELLAISGDPKRFARAWLTGRVKVNASICDILRLRKLL